MEHLLNRRMVAIGVPRELSGSPAKAGHYVRLKCTNRTYVVSGFSRTRRYEPSVRTERTSCPASAGRDDTKRTYVVFGLSRTRRYEPSVRTERTSSSGFSRTRRYDRPYVVSGFSRT